MPIADTATTFTRFFFDWTIFDSNRVFLLFLVMHSTLSDDGHKKFEDSNSILTVSVEARH